jgi:carbon-monoxide dehydrogenase medium subunit
MKPASFEYWAPASLDEAVELLSGFDDPGDAKVLAGGQSLVPLMNLRLAQPRHIVDLNGIEEMTSIGRDGDVLVIGAMCRQRTAERSPQVRKACPLMIEALRNVAHPPIRNRGTVGGSIAHADPAAELPTLAVCLDAELVVRGTGGERVVPAADFFLGFLTTALAEDEVLTAVRLQAAGPGSGAAFEEVARRHGDFAMVGVAATVRLDGDTVSEARIAVSGVAGQPLRTKDVEKSLVGRPANDETFAAAGAAARTGLNPSSDLHASGAYRKHVAGVLIARALRSAAVRARENR